MMPSTTTKMPEVADDVMTRRISSRLTAMTTMMTKNFNCLKFSQTKLLL